MKLIQKLLALFNRNADPVACACKVFNKQVATLSAYTETCHRKVEDDAIAIAKAQERIDANLNEARRAQNIKANIEAITEVRA